MNAATDLDLWLAEVYRPQGHRLGILSAGDIPDAVAAADRTMRAHGFEPARRHAHVQPRPDEAAVRPADLADFVRRYGHEFSAAVIGAAVMDESVAAALASERIAARVVPERATI
jgi:hypothetical protein